MPVVDPPQRRAPATGPEGQEPGSGASLLSSFGRASRSPVALATGACIVLAIVSAAVLPTVPSYDPFSWIVWGREVTDPHLSFLVSGGPSWKPLPFLFTTVWGLFGGAAPTLWVITARVGGLLGLYFAWRLAARLTDGGWAGAAGRRPGRDRHRAHPGLALLLAARHLGGGPDRGHPRCDRSPAGRPSGPGLRPRGGRGLIRPEWWPFIGLYALWLWFRDPAWRGWGPRLLILVGLFLLPFLWFVPPWIGSGQPFLAASHAASYNGHLGADRLHTVLARGVDLQVLPALILAAIAVALGWWRERDRRPARHGRGDRGLVGGSGGHDPGRLPRARALLPARRGADLRARRRRRRAPGALAGEALPTRAWPSRSASPPSWWRSRSRSDHPLRRGPRRRAGRPASREHAA